MSNRTLALAGPAIFALFVSVAVSLSAQTPTGQVTGRITDPSGAVVPAAEVAVTDLNTNIKRTAASNADGYYTVSALPPGEYKAEVDKAGFRPIIRSNFTVSVDQVVRLDFKMEVGSVTEAITVTAAAPGVTTGTGELGTVVSTEQLQNLPLNSRDPMLLAYIVPGFTPSTSFSDAFNRVTSFRIDGGRSNMTDLFIDGVSDAPPASNNFLSYVVLPSPDALQEFKVQKNAFSAEYGRSGGSVINMVMKSGTNQFHGVGYEFLRNSDLDSNNFFSNIAGQPLPSFRRNQFGVAVGGPIIHDKAFFFVNYEGLRQGSAANFTGTFPTSAERTGDFSQDTQLVGSQCLPVQIYDPTTTTATAAGGYVRSPFPNNVIPASRIDPVAAKLMSYFPLPNQPGNACSRTNNYYDSNTAQYTANQLDTKEDWVPTSRDHFFFGFSHKVTNTGSPNYFNNIANTSNGSNTLNPSWGGRLDYTRIQSANTLFDVRLGFGTVSQAATPWVPSSFSAATLGLPAQLDSQVQQPFTFPAIAAANYSSLGQPYSVINQTFQNYSLAGSATIVKGRHTLKFGIDARRNVVTSGLEHNTSGSFSFARSFTQGSNPNVAAANLGDSIASMLLGVGTGFMNLAPSLYTSNFYTGLYAQDDFKVTSNLTLNLGLRYEIETGRKDRFGQETWFDYSVASPIAQQAGLPGLLGGIRNEGLTGESPYPTMYKDFGPRFGFSYAAGGKMVVRGGYGIFYLPYVGQAGVLSNGTGIGAQGFATQTTWVGSLNGLTPTNYLSNPFPTGLLAPTGNKLGLLTNVGQGISDAIDRNSIHPSYVQQWNLTIQRELPGGVLAEAAYVGNKGTHLTDAGWEMNQLTPAQLSLGSALQQLVPNPFYGIIATGPLAASQVARGQLLLPYPEYTDVTNLDPTSASSIYHALTLQIQKHFGPSGGVLLLAYNKSKLIDDSEGTGTGGLDSGHQNIYDRRLERAISPQDISQRMTFSYDYPLPFGRGKRVGSTWSGWLNQVAGNWSINGILTLSTGIPLPITVATNNSGSYSTVERPNIASDAKLSGGRSTAAQLAQWFNTSVFTQPAPFTFGNAPRTLPDVRAPGVYQMDFSIYKDVPFRERFRVQLRGEFFNVTNTPNFGVPGVTFGSGTFGVVSSQANNPREVQFGLKLYF